MNPIEKIALAFLKKELTNNPQLASNFLAHLLEKKGVNPDVVAPITELLTEVIPFLVAEIPA